MPQTVRDHLQALDIQDPNTLANKADALFQSQQSSSVHLLSVDPTAPIDFSLAHSEEERWQWCPCGEYHSLNTCTLPDHYPLPNASDLPP